MGTLDFLFEGSAPESVTRYGSETTNIPQWMSDYTQGLLSRANAIAAEPYQAFPGPRVAELTGDTQRAFDMTRGNVGSGQGVLGGGLSALQSVGGRSSLGAASPYMESSRSALMSAMNPTGVGQGAGLVQAAGTSTFPAAAGTYMNPYIENVIKRGADLATRNFNENLLPGIQDMFTANGMYGSTPMAEKVMRGARDVTENIQSQSNAALADAYKSGADIFGQDMSRQLQAGTGLGALWDAFGGRQVQAGSALGQLGTATGNLANADTGNLLDLSGRFGTLAETLNRLNVSDAAGLEAIGNTQRSVGQQSLDTAYQDFLRQTNYPRDTVDWMSTVIRGLPSSRTTTGSTTGPAESYGPSGIANIGALASLLRGLQPQQSGTT
jgi:hypothetical protein